MQDRLRWDAMGLDSTGSAAPRRSLWQVLAEKRPLARRTGKWLAQGSGAGLDGGLCGCTSQYQRPV